MSGRDQILYICLLSVLILWSPERDNGNVQALPSDVLPETVGNIDNLREYVGLLTIVSYELLKAEIERYQWKVDYGYEIDRLHHKALPPPVVELYLAEIERLTPLLEALEVRLPSEVLSISAYKRTEKLKLPPRALFYINYDVR